MTDKVKLIEWFCSYLLWVSLNEFIDSEYNYYIEGTNILKSTFFKDMLSENNIQKYKTYITTWMWATNTYKHRMDNRTPEWYAKELIIWWITEDIAMAVLEKIWLNVNHGWADKWREILTSPTSDNDMFLNKWNKIIPIEIVSDFTWYRARTKKIQFRDSKFLKIKDWHYSLLCIDFLGKKFQYINEQLIKDAKFIPYHAPWWKPAYELNLNDLWIINILWDDIVSWKLNIDESLF